VRKKQIELEQAVIRAARAYVSGSWSASSSATLSEAVAASRALSEAVAELDAHKPARRLDAPGRWVEGAPETSERAAQLARPALATTRRQIIEQIAAYGQGEMRGFTDQELERRLKKSHTTVSSARNFLVEGGWLCDSGYVRKNMSGRDAVVWELTPAARVAVTEWASS